MLKKVVVALALAGGLSSIAQCSDFITIALGAITAITAGANGYDEGLTTHCCFNENHDNAPKDIYRGQFTHNALGLSAIAVGAAATFGTAPAWIPLACTAAIGGIAYKVRSKAAINSRNIKKNKKCVSKRATREAFWRTAYILSGAGVGMLGGSVGQQMFQAYSRQ